MEPQIIQVSLAVAAALSLKFGCCALPISDNGRTVVKTGPQLLDDTVPQTELARASATIDKAYNTLAADHIPSPVETLQTALETLGNHLNIPNFFALEITR